MILIFIISTFLLWTPLALARLEVFVGPKLEDQEVCRDSTTAMFSCTVTGDLTWRLNGQPVSSYTDQVTDIILRRPDLSAVTVLLSEMNGMRSSILLLSQAQNDDYTISCSGQTTTVNIEDPGMLTELSAVAMVTNGLTLFNVSWGSSSPDLRYQVQVSGLVKETVETREFIPIEGDISNLTVTVTPINSCGTRGPNVSVEASILDPAGITSMQPTDMTTAVPTTTSSVPSPFTTTTTNFIAMQSSQTAEIIISVIVTMIITAIVIAAIIGIPAVITIVKLRKKLNEVKERASATIPLETKEE